MDVCVMWVRNDDIYKEREKKKMEMQQGFDCAWAG